MLVEVSGEHRRGAISEADGHTFAAAAEHALAAGLPLLATIASSGADVNDGVAALHGWGTAARMLARCSGRVPVLIAATGPVVSGPALLLGLADQVVMTEDAYAFVSGPRMVETFTGESVEAMELGGAGIHASMTGVAALVVADIADAKQALFDLLAYLPSVIDEEPPRWWTDDPVDRPTPEAGACIPASPTGAYDVRDGRGQHRGRRRPARAARPLGAEPRHRAWPRSAAGRWGSSPTSRCRSRARSTSRPRRRAPGSSPSATPSASRSLTLVDTPGFYPGKDLEWRGMIRHGAQLAFAYARASVPRVAVVLRKAYGGAYIVMDCRTHGQRPLPGVAVGGDRGDGRQGRGRDPAPQ